MDRGALAITHTNRNDNTLPWLRSCLYPHSHIFSCDNGCETPIFKSQSTKVEHFCSKVPILLNAFLGFPHIPLHPPPHLTCTVPPSLCGPATILSCSRSHRSLASAQSLEQGAQLGRQGLQYVWQCFSRPLYTERLKGLGGHGCSGSSVS